MQIPLLIAAILTAAVGIAHSYLGERYVLVRLFRRSDLPRLFGSDLFTRRTLRFAWHLTSVAWWGFSALLNFLAAGAADLRGAALGVVAVTFAIHAAITGGMSHGRHLAWIPFLAIAVLAWTAR
jgi:hypothetical protein